MLGHAALGQYPLGEADTDPTADQWFSQLSTPYLRKFFLSVEQPFIFQDTPEIITISGWLLGLSEPVRFKPGLRASNQSFLFQDHAPPYAESVTIDRWLLGLSEPIRLNLLRPLKTALHPYLFQDHAPPYPESVTVDRWLLGLSVPSILAKKGIPTREQQYLQQSLLDIKETVTVDRWLLGLSVPSVLKKKGLSVTEQAFDFYTDRSVPFISIDKWLFQWVNPVRILRGQHAARQDFLFYPSYAFTLIYLRKNLFSKSARSFWDVALPTTFED